MARTDAATSPNVTVFFSAGEASADAYAAALVHEMQSRTSESLDFTGLGGPKMRQAGVRTIGDSAQWGAISIVESLRVYPRIVRSFYRAKRALTQTTPGLFIPIDFGYVNIRLARHAKRLGWKVLYFIPPGSWRRDRQGADLPKITEAIATPFPWSAEMLNQMGARAHWFGHPIKSLMRTQGAPTVPRTSMAVLPGSRGHEISANLPVIAEAVKGLTFALEFALAPSVDEGGFRSNWEKLTGRTDDRFTLGDTRAVLLRARVGIVCSGTATLEAALCRCPMVVVYQANDAMRAEEKVLSTLRLFKRPTWIALPNILLGREVVPEMIDRVDPSELRSRLKSLDQEGPERDAQLRAFEELDAMLGPNDAVGQTAVLALELLQG